MSGKLDNRRHHDILMALIQAYVDTAEPVGSRSLVERFGLEFSPATVRAVMAELESQGYLHQPHTSAGRVPTEKAFRYFVDTVGDRDGLTPAQAQMIKGALDGADGVEDLLRRTSRFLSDASSCLGFVLPPRRRRSAFRRRSFVRIRARTILVVMVSVSGVTTTRLVSSFEDQSQESLDRMSAYLNERFHGLSLPEMKSRLEEDLRLGLENFERYMRSALQLGRSVVAEAETMEMYVEGTSHILELPESFTDISWVRRVFRAFEEKQALLGLLEQVLRAGSVTTLIGSETGLTDMTGVGMVVSSYENGISPLGAVGVLGPVRMNYRQVIPLVRATATLVSRHLSRNQI